MNWVPTIIAAVVWFLLAKDFASHIAEDRDLELNPVMMGAALYAVIATVWACGFIAGSGN